MAFVPAQSEAPTRVPHREAKECTAPAGWRPGFNQASSFSGGSSRSRILWNTITRDVVAALELMENHVADPLDSAQLARSVGLSLRQLERLFRDRLARTPMQQYRAIRLERARTLIRQSSLSLSEIALACGFASTSHFSREYRRRFSTTPAADRAKP